MSDEGIRFSRRDLCRHASALGLGAALLSVGVNRARAGNYRATERHCATCDFWRGERTAASDKASVAFADDAMGICDNVKSPLYGKRTRANQLFKDGWVKWHELA